MGMEKSGTLSYAAPEIYADIGADTCADVWSLGVVLYVILVGASPFRTSADEVREDIVRRIQGGYYEQRRVAWQNLSESAQDITHKFLIVDETKRLTCREALRHPWVDHVSHLSPRCTSLDGSPVTVALQALAALTHFLYLGMSSFLLSIETRMAGLTIRSLCRVWRLFSVGSMMCTTASWRRWQGPWTLTAMVPSSGQSGSPQLFWRFVD